MMKAVAAPMSGSEVLGCVDLVLAAFTEGADLTAQLSKKHKKKNGAREYHETLLHSVLAQGSRQIKAHYNEGYKRGGEAFQIGDDTARDRLLVAAIELHSSLIGSLQSAIADDRVQLDLVKLHEKVITSRHDVLRSLDDLCLRQNPSWPLEAPFREPPTDSMKILAPADTYKIPTATDTYKIHDDAERAPTYMRHARNSVLIEASSAPSPSMVPSTSPSEPKRSGIMRMFSGRLSTHSRSRSSSLVELPANNAGHHRKSSSKGSLKHLASSEHPDLPQMRPKSIQHSKTSSKSSSSSNRSNRDSLLSYKCQGITPTTPLSETCSDNFIPPPLMLHTDLPQPPLPPRAVELDDTSSVDSRTYDDASCYSVDITPVTPITPITEELPHHISSIEEEGYMPSPVSPMTSMGTWIPPIPGKHPAHQLSNSFSSSHATCPTAPLNATFGRPCRSNNYHGFCKGAWSTREEQPASSKAGGLNIRMIPSGYYERTPHWSCTHCSFRSPAITNIPSHVNPRNLVKEKGSIPLPEEIYISGSGIAYRWLFLARSHVRCKDAHAAAEGRFVYGCIFCSVEGRESGIYGNVDTLMAHIDTRHAGRMSPETALRTRCVEGRVADKREDWDINICLFDI